MKNFAILLVIIFWLNIICYGPHENYNGFIKEKKNNAKSLFFGIYDSFLEYGAPKSFESEKTIEYLNRKTSGYFWIFLAIFISAIIISILYLYWDIIHKWRVRLQN